jgi:hypothetical protein
MYIGLLDHFTTRLETASNYSAIANLHNSEITTAPVKPFPACFVYTSCSLVTASKSGDPSVSTLKSSLHSLPYKTDLVSPVLFLITPQHGPSREH